MKKFAIGFIVSALAVCLAILALYLQADGHTDKFYVKFTTPKQESLILGNSRAARGIMPEVLNKELGTSLYNFAFNIYVSPYGPSYLDAVRRKVDEASTNGTFILSVNPIGISTHMHSIENDSIILDESTFVLGKTKSVSQKYNFQYLAYVYDQPPVNIIINKFENSFVHDDGWAEDSSKESEAKKKKRLEAKIESYKGFDYSFSDKRFNGLRDIISLLKAHGNVYLLRMPCHSELFEVEETIIPDFEDRMISLAEEMDVSYFNMTSLRDDFEYVDGSHLDVPSARQFSKILADSIHSARKSY